MFVLILPKSKKTAKIVFIFISVMLAASLLAALIFACRDLYRSNTWGCVMAEVSDYDTSDSQNVWTEFSYTYDEKDYTIRKSGHSYYMGLSDQLTIFCNPSNPEQIAIEKQMYSMAVTFFILSVAVGIFFIIYLINFLTVSSREKKRKVNFR
ncbi:MAG: DUF3592 domain-containing protein [Firmicutes bacterium]|nr:DUF3592 domain-containing protein [Bacillota bacterium]